MWPNFLHLSLALDRLQYLQRGKGNNLAHRAVVLKVKMAPPGRFDNFSEFRNRLDLH
jgi:hypothetical protein